MSILAWLWMFAGVDVAIVVVLCLWFKAATDVSTPRPEDD